MRRFLCFWLASCFAAAVSAAGCGGADGSGLFGSGNTSGSSGSSGGSSGNSSSGSSGTSSGSSGTSSSGSSGPGKDAGPPPSFGCGTNAAGAPFTCVGGTACCALENDNLVTVTVTYACEPTPSDCKTSGSTTGAVISCHNSAECGGRYCCGQYDGRLYTSVACSSTCVADGDGGLDSHVRFCDMKNGNAECPPGETCAESTLLSGFYRCAAP